MDRRFAHQIDDRGDPPHATCLGARHWQSGRGGSLSGKLPHAAGGGVAERAIDRGAEV